MADHIRTLTEIAALLDFELTPEPCPVARVRPVILCGDHLVTDDLVTVSWDGHRDLWAIDVWRSIGESSAGSGHLLRGGLRGGMRIDLDGSRFAI
jgi:hypothetical protein